LRPTSTAPTSWSPSWNSPASPISKLLAVEGFAWLLDDLPQRMADPGNLLRAIRLTESEPSMLGASAHVIGSARLP
jgi:hypothetical protein